MQAGGNRARFFAPQAVKPLDVSSMATNPESSIDANSMLSSSCSEESPPISSESNNPNNLTYSSAVVPFNKRALSSDTSHPSRSSSDTSENDTIAQRTRIIETELIFKPKREGHGRLNVSGLINHNHADAKALNAEPQGANIKEVTEHEDLATRSPGPQSCSKLITKTITSRYPTPTIHLAPSPPPNQNGSFDLPPSNQLASPTFHVPSHYASRPDITAEDAPANQMSTAAQDGLNNTHIPSGLSTSCDDTIKSLTAAFNRKHGGGSRKPRFSSPVSHNRTNRLNAPHFPSEGDSLIDFSESHGGHGLRVESRNLSSVRNDREGQPSNCQGSQGYHGSAPMHHGTQESNTKRGLKRTNASGVGSEAPGGKRARMDTYDEFLSKHSAAPPTYDSPGADERENNLFEEAASQGQITRQDPSVKLFSGQALDDYVAIHMDRYEAAKKRWSECSGDEWERGADELADKLTSVLDFVKEHMKRRVALYASLHSKIDQHQKERAETSEMLRNAKSKLVAKAGVVVDGGKS